MGRFSEKRYGYLSSLSFQYHVFFLSGSSPSPPLPPALTRVTQFPVWMLELQTLTHLPVLLLLPLYFPILLLLPLTFPSSPCTPLYISQLSYFSPLLHCPLLHITFPNYPTCPSYISLFPPDPQRLVNQTNNH